jgi:hypothetical protein
VCLHLRHWFTVDKLFMKQIIQASPGVTLHLRLLLLLRSRCVGQQPLVSTTLPIPIPTKLAILYPVAPYQLGLDEPVWTRDTMAKPRHHHIAYFTATTLRLTETPQSGAREAFSSRPFPQIVSYFVAFPLILILDTKHDGGVCGSTCRFTLIPRHRALHSLPVVYHSFGLEPQLPPLPTCGMHIHDKALSQAAIRWMAEIYSVE